MASQLIISPARRRLFGRVPLPSDQEINLARVALSALSRGTTKIRGYTPLASVESLREGLITLGVESCLEQDSLSVEGRGLFGLRAPPSALDTRGEAGVGALLLGLLVSSPFEVELLVDEVVADLLLPALSQRHRIEAVRGHDRGVLLRLLPSIDTERPQGLEVATHGVFPWVKQALLLAGLRAQTTTVVDERFASFDHLERAFLRSRMPLDAEGTATVLHPPRDEDACAPQIYDSVGAADLLAPLGVAAGLIEGSEVGVKAVSLNPTRRDVLTAFDVFGIPTRAVPTGDNQGEPFGDVGIGFGSSQPGNLSGEAVIRLGDSVFPFMVLAAMAKGTSSFEDLIPRGRGGDPRIVGRVLGLLRSAGVDCQEAGGRVTIEGKGPRALRALRVTTGGDYRLALLASLLSLVAEGESVVDDVDCLRQVFPRWVGTLRALGAEIEVRSA